jgi:hypothetical protein
MTHFLLEQITEQPDRIFVEIDRRFNVEIIRTEASLELRIYPRTQGALWDEPFTTFLVDDAEIMDLEKEFEV